MNIKVIFVEPEYEINIGMAARILKNFSIKKMYLVKPKCVLGFSARMYAKHATKLIETAKIYNRFEDSIKDCDLVIGTTGSIERNASTGKLLTISEIKKGLEDKKIKRRIALLFGSEGTGLKKEHIEKCDLLMTIPTSRKYPVMNITNALAICLYEFKKIASKKIGKDLASKKEREYIKNLVLKKIEKIRQIKDKEKIKNVLFSIIEKKFLTKIEAKALIYLFKY